MTSWILIVTILVSCSISRIKASDGEAVDRDQRNLVESDRSLKEELISRLRDGSTTVMDAEMILNGYENKEEKLFGYTVGELTGMCKESLENCSLDNFKRITKVTYTYHRYQNNISVLYNYGLYCRHEKLKNYCLENIDRVQENLMNSVSDEDKELVGPFRKSLQEAGVLERAHEVDVARQKFEQKATAIAEKVARDKAIELGDLGELAKSKIISDAQLEAKTNALKNMPSVVHGKSKGIYEAILNAYSDCMKDKCGPKISTNQQEQFLHNFMHSMKHYADMYLLFFQLNDRDQSGPALKEKSSIDMFKFGRIAERFYYHLSQTIFEQLQKRIMREWGQVDKRDWLQFARQTKDAIVKGQEEREATTMRSTKFFNRFSFLWNDDLA